MIDNVIKCGVSCKVVDEAGNEYGSIKKLAKAIGANRTTITRKLKGGKPFTFNGHTYRLADVSYIGLPKIAPIDTAAPSVTPEATEEIESQEIKEVYTDEYQEFLESKEVRELPFESFDVKVKTRSGGSKYAIALFSDAHLEETVDPQTVLGLNEYNVSIAEERIKAYFTNLVKVINIDKPDTLIFASLGDTISGYIHDELSQCNGLSPLEATYKAQNLLFNGLTYLCENTEIKDITFIGIVGNHSRTTKKIQHANGYKLSYEWLMYQNLKDVCEMKGLPIHFDIPNSELAHIKTDDGKTYIFAHGFQIRGSGNGTVCGIYPSLNRLSMKWEKTFKQDKIFIGHFHSCISIPNATVNGSIIGYNSFSLTNGFAYEEPAQMYELYDTNIGQIITRKIYCK